MKLAKTIAFAMMMSCLPSCVRSQPGPMLDKSMLSTKPTFVEDFSKPPSFYDPLTAPNGRWKTNYAFSIQRTDDPRGWEARTLRPNQEAEYYGDPTRGMSAFEWKPGSITIVGQPNRFRSDPRTHDLPYLSGLITTEKSFQQLYGYFEARVTMPTGKGIWPAFWLLPPFVHRIDPHQPQPQQEIDIFEDIGDRDKLHLTVHRDVNGKKVPDAGTVAVDDVGRPHDYGLLWTRDEIVWYIDQREVRRRPNVDFNVPAYMLLNLAIGGKWPGFPDATTPFPARMKIDWVRVYALKP